MSDERRRILLYVPNRRSKGRETFDVDLEHRISENDDLQSRWGRTVIGESVVLLTARSDAGVRALEREIQIGTRLALSHPGDSYPPQLSRLLGFDARPPKVALFTSAGRPLAERREALSAVDRIRATRTLFTALERLQEAKVVHGALSPETVRWDPEAATIQITGFSNATTLGGERPAGPPEPPWIAPEQARGGTAADSDDLYCAALLLFWLHTGERPEQVSRQIDNADAGIRQRLSGAFALDSGDRPTLHEMARRWHPRVAMTTRPAERARDDEAVRVFAELRGKQRADLSPLLDPSVVVPGTERPEIVRAMYVAGGIVVSVLVVFLLIGVLV